MNLAEQSSFVQSLVDQPYDQHTLLTVYEAIGKDPKAYAALLVTAAESTDQHAAASHWLTEAARVRMQALRDDRGGVELLEAALERDPLNLRAAEHLVELYRARKDDAELAGLLRARAAALHDRYVREPVELPRAAMAFEKLSGVYEAIGDSSAAIAALRTALQIERARVRQTTPSPPPEGRASTSSFRALARQASSAAPPPQPLFTTRPPDRDTLPSPIPAPSKESQRLAAKLTATESASPSRRAPGDPLLSVIEALHALRRSDGVAEGAALVLRTALDAIPAATGLVHVADLASRDYVVVAACGEHNAEMIGSRTTDGDTMLARAFDAMQAIAIDVAAGAITVEPRFRKINAGRAVLCAPVQLDGQNLAAIELVDPLEPGGFTDGDRHAMTYVGERFAEFLSDRSIVL
jgi:tetratricopeptide (TPR) repeat protein